MAANEISRRVVCELKGHHNFENEMSLFNMRTYRHCYRNICIVCGVYYIAPPLTNYQPLHKGPDGRMYEYWSRKK